MAEIQEPKKIRFIDNEYNLLFTVPDGGNVVLTFSDGTQKTRACEYIDDYHFRLGKCDVLHICEFAEIMERNGTRYAPEQPVILPDMCYALKPSTEELIVIKRGEDGYFPCAYGNKDSDYNRRTMKRMNEMIDVTPQQRAAMEAGSLFGWETPAADPNRYDVHGVPIPARDQQTAVTYTICQLKDTPDTREFRFVPFSRLPEGGRCVLPERYDRVYTETMYPNERSTDQSLLDKLFYRFNIEHPSDFKGHSLSVSDVVVIERNKIQRAYYVDSIGFTELPSFPLLDNPMKAAELSTEQNHNQIDGVLNNQAPVPEQAEKKPSIQEKLRIPKHDKTHRTQGYHSKLDKER